MFLAKTLMCMIKESISQEMSLVQCPTKNTQIGKTWKINDYAKTKFI